MMSIVESVGMFVNNKTISNNISSWLDGIFCGLMKLTKVLVFWTVYSLLLKGAKILANVLRKII